jgi:hypothetical protein
MVKRSLPAIGSSPMVLASRPSPTMTSERVTDPPETWVTRIRPSTTSAVYSAGPKRIATPDSSGPKSTMPMVAMMPAMKEPKAEMPSAGPARPRRAIS